MSSGRSSARDVRKALRNRIHSSIEEASAQESQVAAAGLLPRRESYDLDPRVSEPHPQSLNSTTTTEEEVPVAVATQPPPAAVVAPVTAPVVAEVAVLTPPPLATAVAPATAPVVGEVAVPAKALPQLNVAFEQRDFDLLDEFHASARRAGVKLRRGSNPALFVRVAMRLLGELHDQDREAWLARVRVVAEPEERSRRS